RKKKNLYTFQLRIKPMVELVSQKEKTHLKYALPFSFITFVVINLLGLIPFPETTPIKFLLGASLLQGLFNLIIYIGILFFCLKRVK
ncbi:MAG: hypothetical protein QF568_05880, partial [Flavobacteriales bacterium]|nr:hypothetical protein [Flavobacteriales bacterium]